MKYFYLPGATRWKRFTGNDDVRCYRASKGWEAFAFLLDEHPVKDVTFAHAQWWIRETYTGG